MKKNSQTARRCLACAWCKTRAGMYGATCYRCDKLGKELTSSAVDGPSCPSFFSGRSVA